MQFFIYDELLQQLRPMTENEIETHLANVARDVNKEPEATDDSQ